jgi:hypothetical protein|tara:strand:+ start:516 stop:692 length:177 start_codon:yes stop_codon:yes gene_type:complete
MKSAAEKLHQTLKQTTTNFAVEFDMTVYEVLGVIKLLLLELWYEHDQEGIGEDFDDDE